MIGKFMQTSHHDHPYLVVAALLMFDYNAF